MPELRPYQESFIADIVGQIKSGHKRVLGVMPTGSGKGTTITVMVQRAVAKSKRTWILVHRAELVADLSGRLSAAGVEHGIIASGSKPDYSKLVQVASVQTIVKRMWRSEIEPPDLIIQDEAHHLTSGNTWGRVVGAYPDAVVIGKTATPERLDGKGLGEPDGFFQAMVLGPSAAWLTDEGFLARARVFCPPVGDGGQPAMRKRAGDYDMRDAADAYGKLQVFGDCISHYRKLVAPGTAIAFCCNVQHAEDVAAAFNEAGITAESLDGKQSLQHRKEALARLASGETKIITSCMIISEGTDVPSVSACIMLRPTMSLSLYLQMVGRCLRPKADGSEAVVLDHVGNVERHGFPTDPREWSLKGKAEREKAEREKAPGVRTCPECFAALPAGTPTCPSCGHEFTPESAAPDQVSGELQELAPKGLRPGDAVTIGGSSDVVQALAELNPTSGESPAGIWHIASRIDSKGGLYLARNKHDAVAHAAGRGCAETYKARARWLSPVEDAPSRHPAAGASTFEDLQRIGEQRGYKPGWARKIWAAREGRSSRSRAWKPQPLF